MKFWRSVKPAEGGIEDRANDALDGLESEESQSGRGQTYPSLEAKAWQQSVQPAASAAAHDCADKVQAINAAVCSSLLLDSCCTHDCTTKVAHSNPTLEKDHSLCSKLAVQPSLEAYRSMGSGAELPSLQQEDSQRCNAAVQPSHEAHRSMGSAAALPPLEEHKSLRSTAAAQPSKAASGLTSKAASGQTSTAEQFSKASDSDVEKGSSQEGSHQPVDFLGGFSVNSTFDPHKDVVLRFEFETAAQLKARAAFVLLSLLLSLAAFIILLLVRSIMPNDFFFRNKSLEVVNTIASSAFIVIAIVAMIAFTRRIINCRRKNMRWSLRRRTMSRIYWIMGVTMIFQLALWLAPNAWSISRSYAWYGRFVAICGILRWSSINLIMILFVVNGHNTNPRTGKEGSLLGHSSDSLVLDAPQWRMHWPKALLWFLFEIPYILQLIEVFGPHYEEHPYTIVPVKSGNCHSGMPFTIVSTYSGGVFMLLYLLMYCWYIHKGFALLRSRPYNSFRVGNILVRIQAARTITAFATAILSCIVLWYSNPHRCASFFFAWQGLFPMQVVLAALVIADCTSYMPRNPNEKDDPILQVWLQQFAWLEREKPEKIAERATYTSDPGTAKCLNDEPLFCLETALKAIYWATLVYRYKGPDDIKEPDKDYTHEQGMAMFGLNDVQLFWERSLDTRVLVGWSGDMIVLSFRGTASLRNAFADIQAWRVTHPPRRGRWWLGQRPLVHRGFYMTWAVEGFNKRVMDHIQKILDASPTKASNMRVLLTGHSLGGAVAMLAAHDLKNKLGLENIQVYTYGSPRPGNRAFKQEYDKLVPDTWNCINDADAIPRIGKFLTLFSRPGKRVIVDYQGDAVVRPSPYEMFIRSGSNPGHHFLGAYRKAFMRVCEAQFLSKAQPGGRNAILELIQEQEMREFFRACELDPEMLEQAALTAAFLSARERRQWRRKAVAKQQDSVLPDAKSSLHRVSLGWRRLFSSDGRRVNDRRSTEAATCSVPEAEPAEVAIAIDQLAPTAATDAQHPLSRHMSLQRADRSGLAALVEQLSSLSDDAAAALEEQLLPASPTKTPPQRLRQGDASLPPLVLSPLQRPALAQVSMSPLMLSPTHRDRSAPPVAHECVQIGQPSSSDALKEVHAEIMDRGVQLPPSSSSRRASLSRHSSEAARSGGAASPSAAASGTAGGQLPKSDFRPLTLAQTWAHISRPPLPVTRGSAAASPMGPPRPRVLTSWRSMPSSAQRMAASQSPPSAFPPGKYITPSSPEWVPSPFSSLPMSDGLHLAPTKSSATSAAAEASPPVTPQAQHAAQQFSTAAPASVQWASSRLRHSMDSSAAIVHHSSARAEMLRSAAQTLSRRTANAQDLQDILQDLHSSSWQTGSTSSAARSALLAEEDRACRDLSACVENAVVPQLGSMAARCSRLISHVSVGLGIRVNADAEMAEPLEDELGAAAAAVESYREQQLAQQHEFGAHPEE